MIAFLKAETGATATTAVVNTKDGRRGVKRLFQVEESLAGTVVLEGRLVPELPWVQVTSRTNGGAELVDVYPQMRVTLTGNTGSVYAYLDA